MGGAATGLWSASPPPTPRGVIGGSSRCPLPSLATLSAPREAPRHPPLPTPQRTANTSTECPLKGGRKKRHCRESHSKHSSAGRSPRRPDTVTAQSQHSHSTVTAQSQHSAHATRQASCGPHLALFGPQTLGYAEEPDQLDAVPLVELEQPGRQRGMGESLWSYGF